MKGVILAAGIASRLRPLTDNTPKCLLEIGGKRILERTIDNLLDCGISNLVIVTGYLENMIREFVLQKYPNLNVEFIYNDKYESTNNIYSLWMTKEKVKDEDILLLDSDILFDKNIIKLLIDSNHENCLAVKSGIELGEEEIKITVAEDNSIIEISKEVNPKFSKGESIGIEKFGKALVKKLFDILDQMILEEKKSGVFYEAAFKRAINYGWKIFPVDVKELHCMELDTVEDVEQAQKTIDFRLV